MLTLRAASFSGPSATAGRRDVKRLCACAGRGQSRRYAAARRKQKKLYAERPPQALWALLWEAAKELHTIHQNRQTTSSMNLERIRRSKPTVSVSAAVLAAMSTALQLVVSAPETPLCVG